MDIFVESTSFGLKLFSHEIGATVLGLGHGALSHMSGGQREGAGLTARETAVEKTSETAVFFAENPAPLR